MFSRFSAEPCPMIVPHTAPQVVHATDPLFAWSGIWSWPEQHSTANPVCAKLCGGLRLLDDFS